MCVCRGVGDENVLTLDRYGDCRGLQHCHNSLNCTAEMDQVYCA